jgi:hypothetical protein
MSDPITLGIASTAVGLVNTTIGLLKQAKEAAKESDDHNLKDKLSEVYDSFLDLKEVIGNLRDENADLRKQLETRASLLWNSGSKLYYAEGDPDPFCPACMDLNARRVRLQLVRAMTGVSVGYVCKVCENNFSGR